MIKWQLQFRPKMIGVLAGRYIEQTELPVAEIRHAREAGEYTFDGFLALCEWKSPRSKSRCRKNTPDEVAEITRTALSASNERLRIGSLLCLHGVSWPTASVLLHFAHADPYPILDVRALWSLGFDKAPAYSFEFWWQYVQECRELAHKHGVDMRTLDRALWQYSKEQQGGLK